MMKTLMCLQLPPPPYMKWAGSPLMLTPINHPQSPLYTIRTSELGVRAKGFGETVTISNAKRRREDETNHKNGGNEDDDDEIPKVVFERMLVRILFTVGAPMGTGVGLLYLLGVLKERNVWDVPMWLPLLAILLAFGSSALGIAYGTLSTSWDPDREGSLLGWEETQKNWPQVWREEEESKR
eukprot:TRINITY_DN2537_c0_g2_i1.p1 TRINITY_DN2537_c0_g2~~TRINITY_DN2537_c0_g2_i1.p1  ORF type:complete len:182 (+),score=20.83 TRINITY_DN2537_c0_g2_i1:219-764(+)